MHQVQFVARRCSRDMVTVTAKQLYYSSAPSHWAPHHHSRIDTMPIPAMTTAGIPDHTIPCTVGLQRAEYVHKMKFLHIIVS